MRSELIPGWTTQVSCVSLATVGCVPVLPTLRYHMLVKPLPVTVTWVPTGPEAGVKPVMETADEEAPTVKLVAETALPRVLVTRTTPVVAPLGTKARRLVSL